MDDKLRVAESKNAQATELYNLGNYSTALYMYEIAIKHCPNIAKYYANRSACYLMINDNIKAQTDAQKAIDIDPKYLKCYLRIIKCCLYDGNLKYALTTALRAKEMFPEDKTILNQLETLNFLQEYYQKYEFNFKTRKYSNALEFIESCLNQEPKCIRFLLAKANCLIRLKEFGSAEKIADDILVMNKNDENAMFMKTCAQCYQQDVHSALSLLKKLKQKLPDHSDTNELYTKTLLISNYIKDIEEAIQNYSYDKAYKLTIKALKIDPYYVVTNKRLLRRKIDIAQGDENLHWKGTLDSDEFMNLYGEDLSVLHIKVNLLMNLEEYEDAIEVYKIILNLENNQINKQNLNKAIELFNEQNSNDESRLGLKGKYAKNEITKAATKLKRRYHIDMNPKISSERKKQLEKKFTCIVNAEARLLQKI